MNTNTKPWDDEFDHNARYEQIEKAWKKTTAPEYYFARADSHSDPEVWFCPAAFFDKEGYCYDQSLGIGHLLPTGGEFQMIESMEACYSYEGKWEDLQAELINRGFRENPAFTDFILDQDN